jgi:hypothetical protein
MPSTKLPTKNPIRGSAAAKARKKAEAWVKAMLGPRATKAHFVEDGAEEVADPPMATPLRRKVAPRRRA